ncbi:MAG TPA: hypothetical protein VFZ60_00715 [Nitrososphaeraceae archaeon]
MTEFARKRQISEDVVFYTSYQASVIVLQSPNQLEAQLYGVNRLAEVF